VKLSVQRPLAYFPHIQLNRNKKDSQPSAAFAAAARQKLHQLYQKEILPSKPAFLPGKSSALPDIPMKSP
jgi:hypothetical protein